jgi:protein tyrosine phosphatase (PTP) superfamily phosphohydrolase (DUF442 family)
MDIFKPFRFIANHVLGLYILLRDKVVSLFIDHSKQPSNPDFPNVYIKNFGQMDEKLYRGAQPLELDVYKQLFFLGIKTVINLRDDPDPRERERAESFGMTFINIPIVGGTPPTMEDAKRFMEIMNDPNSGKVFLHCKGGRHRTGALGAVYRFEKYRWTFDRAYAEMKEYGFFSSWGFGDIKQWVKGYYER